MNEYLQHSSKGTSWVKRQAEYEKKVNKRYYYRYESILKKLWKLKKNPKRSAEYEKLKAEYEASKKQKAYAHAAKSFSKIADKTGSKKYKAKADEYQKIADSLRTSESVSKKLSSISNDTLKRGKAILNKLLKKKG